MRQARGVACGKRAKLGPRPCLLTIYGKRVAKSQVEVFKTDAQS